jgi:hypothetical protein
VEISLNGGYARNAVIVLLVAAGAIVLGCSHPNVTDIQKSASDPYQARRWSSPVFTPAHETFGEAAKHFLNIRPEPRQPLEFPHMIHTPDVGVDCDYCHSGASQGPIAGIPSVNLCMGCHEQVVTGDPRITQLRDYAKKGQDLDWQRVYGFLEESHVRFNHAPHIQAGVECATCHGDLTSMTVAERAVDHTMGFCVDCHKSKQASIDCLVCHY